MIPFVISTYPGREAWLQQCLTSLGYDLDTYTDSDPLDGDVLVVEGWELEAIRAGADEYDRFVYLQDSVEVLDLDALEAAIGDTGSAVFMARGCGGYNGVYEARTVNLVGVPPVGDKDAAIYLETAWHDQYRRISGAPILWPALHDRNGRVVEHLGRRNLVIENEVLRKWKGTWR